MPIFSFFPRLLLTHSPRLELSKNLFFSALETTLAAHQQLAANGLSRVSSFKAGFLVLSRALPETLRDFTTSFDFLITSLALSSQSTYGNSHRELMTSPRIEYIGVHTWFKHVHSALAALNYTHQCSLQECTLHTTHYTLHTNTKNYTLHTTY